MHSPKVMIISEDANTLILLTYALEEKGYHVRGTTKSVEGLVECLQQPPDLVIIKYSSIGEPPDGLTLCRRLRAHAALSISPILMVSARREDAFQAGASAWFDVVFDIEKVLVQVATLLAHI